MPARRPVADRLHTLAQALPKSQSTFNMAEMMRHGLPDVEDIRCTVDRHCRTRIFDFPRSQPTEPIPNLPIYSSSSVQAAIACDLAACFEQSDSAHFAVSPSLRYEVERISEELRKNRNGKLSAFLIIQELTHLTPPVFDAECALSSEVTYRDGKTTPIINGGREGEKFILAMKSSDGNWPNIPSNEPTINMILAAVRASQDEHDEIRKHVDQACFLTDDRRFVYSFPEPTMSARLSVASNLDAQAFEDATAKLASAISCLESDMPQEHIELLVNALYWDDYKDDDFRRLHYLSLWQSLSESSRRLGHFAPGSPKISGDITVIAGMRSLADLSAYRHDIAHWWTGSMDGNYLADIYRTINELVRRKYFR